MGNGSDYLLLRRRPARLRRAASYAASGEERQTLPASRARANSLEEYALLTSPSTKRPSIPPEGVSNTESNASLAGGFIDFEGKIQEKRNFVNWMWPDPNKLARSSAPGYNVKAKHADRTQNMTADAIRELKENGISNVLSLNEFRLTADQIEALRAEGIRYLWLPVKDFKTPTVSALLEGCEFIDRSPGATLAYCGFGIGRTGMLTAAWEIYNGKDRYNAIHGSTIETPLQFIVLQTMPTREQFPWCRFPGAKTV